MALSLGTNSGFCSAAPVDDPADLNTSTYDNTSRVARDTSPATAIKITEVGWWCDTATEEANFDVGLYSADGAVVPGEAGTRLYNDTEHAKGTTAGWKSVTGLNWSISSSTTYWIGVAVDNTATATQGNWNSGGTGAGYDIRSGVTVLNDPFGGGALTNSTNTAGIYAVWEGAAPGTTQINIGDAWKDIDWTASKINIGDAWKTITGVQINIGDTWKTVYAA